MAEFEKDATMGLPKEWCDEVQAHLRTVFRADGEQTAEGIQTSLWEAVLREAGDVEQEVIPRWLRTGFPLGIHGDIGFTGVFARTNADTDAVLASREEGVFLADDEGLLTNYASFQEAGPLAQEIVEKMVQQGRLQQFETWEEVQLQFRNARLSRMGWIVKERSDKTLKVRLVIDTRRSGVNRLATIRERVILPRVADVAASWKRLRQCAPMNAESEMMSADFSEAFNTLNLKESERGFLVIKGLTGKYYVSRVVLFGAAAGPLPWCRLIASAMRLTQALAWKGESEVSTFVDDPVIVAVATSQQDRSWIFIRSLVFWVCLGLKLSWSKAQRGSSLVWIGFELNVSRDHFTVRLSSEKRDKLLGILKDLQDSKGMMAVSKLQHAAGLLGWVTSAIPAARPWMGMIWAALLQAKDPVRETTRVRKGLIFVRQVEHALRWITTLVQSLCCIHGSLQKSFPWRDPDKVVLIQTDACPFGMGGFIMIAGSYQAFWHDEITNEDCRLIGCTVGDPSFQSELELLALLVSLVVFRPWLQRGDSSEVAVVFRTDNTATIQAALQFQASSPIMMQLCAEMSLRLETMQVASVMAQHVPGALNVICDALSRLSQGAAFPSELAQCKCLTPPVRDESFYMAWPEVEK